MTDARQNMTSRELGFDQRSLAATACSLSELPAIATQDWVERCAATLTHIDPWCRVAVAIAHVDVNGKIGVMENVGVRCSEEETARLPDPKGDQLSARVRLERTTDLGVALPAGSMTTGLAAAAEDLGNWRDGQLGRIWNPASVERLLIGVCPLGGEPGERAVLVLVALGPAPANAARASARTLAALLPVMAKRVWMAIPAHGPISWLTDREQDVLDRLILGGSVREISDELGRSPHTVHDHVKSLHRKLSASSRGELVARALGHAVAKRADLDPTVVERIRAAGQIEPSPGVARRVGLS